MSEDKPVAGYTLDTGALIALEKGGKIRALLRKRVMQGVPMAIPAGVLAEWWRGGHGRQAEACRLLLKDREHVEIVALTRQEAMKVGIRLGDSGLDDTVDAHVAVVAADRSHKVITSNAEHIGRADPELEVIAV